jgi:crotonobetainyl-CoA:carnitine CoA-transferase CaiB-like acyl-CoA transferase
MKPLENLVVLEFCEFLSGPSAGLRLADLGARVIKIEKPGAGDACRRRYLNHLAAGRDSVLFHTINRNKESFAADLGNPEDLAAVRKLLAGADVLIESYPPGTMAKFGLDYERVRDLNPRLVYASVTGYGKDGPWKDKPAEDLLVQALSGLTWLNGDAGQPPVPFGLPVVDILAGAFLVQGILACLVRRGKTGEGGLVEVSLLETVLDFQFEVLTTYLNDGGRKPQRSAVNNAHAYLGAPYGIYATKDGYLALAMGSLVRLGELLGCPEAAAYTDPKTWFTHRDEIKAILAAHLKTKTTREWLDVLEPADYWCAEVFNWERLLNHEGFQVLDMIQEIGAPGGGTLRTTRCPIRINGELFKAGAGAPAVGEHNERIAADFGLLTSRRGKDGRKEGT